MIHTPHVTTRMELPWTFSTFDYRTSVALLFEQGDASFETAKIKRADRNRTVHTDRGDLRAPLVVDCTGMAAGSRVGGLPAARSPAVARPGGPSRRSIGRSRDLDRPRLRSRRLRLELPGHGRDQGRRRVIRAATPREGIDGPPGGGPRARRRALPGQLDPPPAPSRHRGRHLLRRGLGRALPAPHGRGNPDRLLLRHRLRSRVATGDRRAGYPRPARWSATERSPTATCGTSPGSCGSSASSQGFRRGCWRRASRDEQRRVRALVVQHYLRIAHPAYARELVTSVPASGGPRARVKTAA